MDIILILFWSFLLCLIVGLLIFTFPISLTRDTMKKGVRKAQLRFIIITAIVSIVAIVLYRYLSLSIACIEITTSLMIIPLIACVVFSALLYYPSIRILVKMKMGDQKIIDQIVAYIFKSAYCDKAERNTALTDLKAFLQENEPFIKQYGLDIHLAEYINHTTFTATNKPPESMINCVLNKCDQVKHEIDHFECLPFPNIGLVLSFVFSTALTIVLSIITNTL